MCISERGCSSSGCRKAPALTLEIGVCRDGEFTSIMNVNRLNSSLPSRRPPNVLTSCASSLLGSAAFLSTRAAGGTAES